MGFVSNSSTSSFCIYGTSFDFKKVKANHANDEDFNEDDFRYDGIESLAEAAGLEVHHTDYDWYVGMQWDEIGDDETGSQFKQRVKESIQKFLGSSDDITLNTIEEAWYNG
jgi:hypothetical protein